jgi:hypothetical protein
MRLRVSVVGKHDLSWTQWPRFVERTQSRSRESGWKMRGKGRKERHKLKK